jgi:hypothetical protein
VRVIDVQTINQQKSSKESTNRMRHFIRNWKLSKWFDRRALTTAAKN